MKKGDKLNGRGWSAEVLGVGNRGYGSGGRTVTLDVTWATGRRQVVYTNMRRLNSGATQKSLDGGEEKTSE